MNFSDWCDLEARNYLEHGLRDGSRLRGEMTAAALLEVGGSVSLEIAVQATWDDVG
jgi:hypothetical protein